MEAWEAINRVRVIRAFADRPLVPEHVERILNAGRRAGSSRNEQRWAFIVVHDREHLRELTAVGPYADHLAGAGLAVALVVPVATGTGPHEQSVMWDLGRAAQNMILAAWGLGIGSAPATVFDHALAGRSLGLPPDQRCDYLLSFGYPADAAVLTAPNRAIGRKPLSAVVHKERW